MAFISSACRSGNADARDQNPLREIDDHIIWPGEAIAKVRRTGRWSIMSDDTADDRGFSEPEIVRLKFTLPKRKADRFQALANKHHAGNTSEFLRSAGEDYAHTLNGGGRTLLRETLDEVKHNGEAVDELQKALNESDSASEQPSVAEKAGAASEVAVEEEVNDHDVIEGDMWPVYREIADAYPGSLCVNEIVSSGNLPETDVRDALIDLQDCGKITASSVGDTTQYKITVDEFE